MATARGKALSSRAWSSLTPPLAEWVLEAVSSMGFERMTPVQASTIPLFMAYKDVVVEAVTGSGKTLSFVIPVVERLLRADESCKKHHVASIIISPTRELATQTYNVLSSILAFHEPSAAALARLERQGDQAEDNEDGPLQSYPSSTPKVVPQLVVGGSRTPAEDLEFFLRESPNVLVATPGRLWELLCSPNVHCTQSSFEVLVLDEADRLLDLGFEEVVEKILGRLPKQRRTGLFSASVSEAVDQLIKVGLRNPVKIAVKVKGATGQNNQITPTSLQLSYTITPASHKLPSLFKLLHSLEPAPSKSIIYLSTCAAVDYFQHVLPQMLSKAGNVFTLIPLHGKHPSNVRQKNFSRFSNATNPCILLTTDVAARGLDVPQVDLVVQIDPPSDPKVFLHRCGRAGRAGRTGLAVLCLQEGREEDYIPFLSVRKTPVQPLESPNVTVSPEEVTHFSREMRAIVRADRALHDKAQRGFVSWVQAYRKHQAKSIFQLTDLDWKDLGNAWALLKMPKMPELKRWDGDRTLGLDLDFSSYEYKDKQRELQRRQSLSAAAKVEDKSANGAAEQHIEGGTLTNKPKRAWSQKLDEKEERERRREKRGKKREHEKWEAMTPAERQQKRELDALIQTVKKQRTEEQDDVFEGFSD